MSYRLAGLVHAEAVVRDFTLGYGQVVFDYLAGAQG